jgi:hypothetical protein
MKNDRSIRGLLAVIALLLGANVLAQLTTAAPANKANAAIPGGGIPDSGAQFKAMIDQLTEMNKKIDKMQTYIESGALTVKIKEAKPEK